MMQAVDRLPPHNLEAEQSVLGSLLIDRDAVIRIASYVKPGDFYRSAHRLIYEAILNLYNRREPTDLITLVDELRRNSNLDDAGGESYLTELIAAVPTSVHVEYYGRIVERTATLRRLIEAGTDVVGIGYDDSLDIEEAIDKSEQAIFAVAARRQTKDFRSIGEVLEEYFDRLDTLHQHKGTVVGVPTGYADLDKLTGGLQPSDLIIIAARPAVGKSSLGLGIAYNAAVHHAKTVALFVLEMSSEQIVQRLLAMETGIDSHRLRLGYIDDSEWSSVTRAFGRLSEANIFIDDTAGVTIMDLRSKARRLHAERGLDLIIIDYLQLMSASGRNENRVQEISAISRALKQLARELNVPVIALAQLSRAVEQRTSHVPMLSDLRESGCLNADTVVLDPVTGLPERIADIAARGYGRVWAIDDRLRMGAHEASRAFATGVKPVLELRLASGKRIRATANHPFRTVHGWTALDELRPGVAIATARSIPEPGVPTRMDDQELILLAHLLGDDCIAPRQPIHYTSGDRHCIDAVAAAAAVTFGVAPRVVAQKNWWHVYLPSPTHLTHGRSHPITRWLRALGLDLCRSLEKQIPSRVFSLSNEQLATFLRHLWATDGNLSRVREGQAVIYYASTSRALADQLQLLLLRFGIVARMKTISKGGYRDCYHVHISGADHQIRFLEEVGCFGQRGQFINQLLDELRSVKRNPNADVIPRDAWSIIGEAKDHVDMSWRAVSAGIETAYCGSTLFKSGLSRERMARVATAVPSSHSADLAESDVFWDEIMEISHVGDEVVYDLTVPGPHNFLANGVFAHNSIEQDADIVGFIYREDVYDPDTERKGIADLIIAKHRNGPVGTVHLRFFDRTARFADLELYREPDL